METQANVPALKDRDEGETFSLSDSDILVAPTEKSPSAELRHRLQNQQNFQNN